ncbi:hypothetical protein [Pseudomonas palleroniana]
MNLIISRNLSNPNSELRKTAPGDILGLSIEAMTCKAAFHINDKIQQVAIVRRADLSDAHWEVFLTCHGSFIKIDLTKDFYRVLYMAALPVGRDITTKTITLTVHPTLGDVLRAVSDVAEEKGPWTGTDGYNCQDFAIALTLRIGLLAEHIRPFELRRAATKRTGRAGFLGIGDNE